MRDYFGRTIPAFAHRLHREALNKTSFGHASGDRQILPCGEQAGARVIQIVKV
jgi:hypothetical protein